METLSTIVLTPSNISTRTLLSGLIRDKKLDRILSRLFIFFFELAKSDWPMKLKETRSVWKRALSRPFLPIATSVKKVKNKRNTLAFLRLVDWRPTVRARRADMGRSRQSEEKNKKNLYSLVRSNLVKNKEVDWNFIHLFFLLDGKSLTVGRHRRPSE